jgi:type IV secretory pathway VirB2 component (pilin)
MQPIRTLALNTRARLSAAVLTLATLPAFSFAQTDPFTTAVTTISDKIETYGAALVGVAAVGVVFMVAMKYVKKLPRAA